MMQPTIARMIIVRVVVQETFRKGYTTRQGSMIPTLSFSDQHFHYTEQKYTKSTTPETLQVLIRRIYIGRKTLWAGI
jgi:hypothetical protein